MLTDLFPADGSAPLLDDASKKTQARTVSGLRTLSDRRVAVVTPTTQRKRILEGEVEKSPPSSDLVLSSFDE